MLRPQVSIAMLIWRRMSLLPKLILAVLSVTATLAVGELALRLLFPPERFIDHNTNAYRQAIARKAEGIPAGANIERDPQLGWRMKRNYRSANASHNSRGFRGSQEFHARPAGRRILAIGDSFTYGVHVGQDATYAARLGVLLDAEVINAGVNGYGVDQALLMWEAEGRRIRPETVVLGYFTDDFHRNAFTAGVMSKPRFVLSGDGARLVHEPPPQAEVSTAWRPRIFGLLHLSWRRLANRLGFPPVSMLHERQDLSERLLARLQASVSAAGANLVVLIIPHCAYPRDGHYGAWIAAMIAESCVSLGLTCVDFTDMADPSLYEQCHWNEEGHRRAAQRIAKTLHSAR